MRIVSRLLGALLLFGLAFAAPQARAEVVDLDPEYAIYVWPKWQKGVELGARALGRFGTGSNINAPPGDFVIQAQYHIWYQHLVDVHLNLGFGIGRGAFMFGIGSRVNIVEFIEDPTREMMVRGLQRGVLSKVLKNFMLFFSLDYLRFSFP